MLGAFNGLEHFKKGCIIPPGFANVGIGNNDHSSGIETFT